MDELRQTLADCQCKTWPDASCSSLATQEDLLCDNCRTGCHLICIGGGEPFHGRITEFRYSIPSAADFYRVR